MSEKAILVVSFGTSFPETRSKTINAIESYIQHAHPRYAFYHAWTSRIIRQKLLQRDGESIPDVADAFRQMEKDGVKNVFVQPTHIIPGIENTKMKEDAQKWSEKFNSISFGNPLLSSPMDYSVFLENITKEYSFLPDSEALLFMGHGTEHEANSIYSDLDHAFQEAGYSNYYVGTVEGATGMDSDVASVKGPDAASHEATDLNRILSRLSEKNYQKIHLAPLMIVAGDHAINDMSGKHADSWESILKEHGYHVECHIKGLGEYDFIQEMLNAHLCDILS